VSPVPSSDVGSVSLWLTCGSLSAALAVWHGLQLTWPCYSDVTGGLPSQRQFSGLGAVCVLEESDRALALGCSLLYGPARVRG
jgi:hypothetical protein